MSSQVDTARAAHTQELASAVAGVRAEYTTELAGLQQQLSTAQQVTLPSLSVESSVDHVAGARGGDTSLAKRL